MVKELEEGNPLVSLMDAQTNVLPIVLHDHFERLEELLLETEIGEFAFLEKLHR